MICEDCIHNAVCDRLYFENHCGYKHTEADIINPELEKIKAEIYRHHNITCNLKCATCFLEYNCELRRKIDLLEDLAIIDNHIKELKGE